MEYGGILLPFPSGPQGPTKARTDADSRFPPRPWRGEAVQLGGGSSDSHRELQYPTKCDTRLIIVLRDAPQGRRLKSQVTPPMKSPLFRFVFLRNMYHLDFLISITCRRAPGGGPLILLFLGNHMDPGPGHFFHFFSRVRHPCGGAPLHWAVTPRQHMGLGDRQDDRV